MKQSSLPLELGPPDRLLPAAGASRAYSGLVLEEILTESFRLHPGERNAPTCPDARCPLPDRCPIEIKSLRRNSKLVVYDWRMEKEIEGCLYFIGVHARKGNAGSLAEVWQSFSDTLEEVIIMTAPEIETLARECPLQKIKTVTTASGKRNGYQRAGYKEGYRNIPFRALKELVRPLPFKVTRTIHQLPFCFAVSMSEKAFLQH